jgi:hypothetical protein
MSTSPPCPYLCPSWCRDSQSDTTLRRLCHTLPYSAVFLHILPCFCSSMSSVRSRCCLLSAHGVVCCPLPVLSSVRSRCCLLSASRCCPLSAPGVVFCPLPVLSSVRSWCCPLSAPRCCPLSAPRCCPLSAPDVVLSPTLDSSIAMRPRAFHRNCPRYNPSL